MHGILALALGLLIVFGLHATLTWLVNTKPQHVKRVLQLLAVAGIVAVILFLLRFGAPLIAALVGGFLGLTALLNRLMVFWPILRFWQARKQRAQGSSGARRSGPMTREEAARILNVAPDASPQEIKAAHKQMLKKNHPDRGGSDYLASQINQAKDVLLKRK